MWLGFANRMLVDLMLQKFETYLYSLACHLELLPSPWEEMSGSWLMQKKWEIRSFSGTQLEVWSQVQLRSANPYLTHKWTKIKYCFFKPLNFGVLCYAALVWEQLTNTLSLALWIYSLWRIGTDTEEFISSTERLYSGTSDEVLRTRLSVQPGH